MNVSQSLSDLYEVIPDLADVEELIPGCLTHRGNQWLHLHVCIKHCSNVACQVVGCIMFTNLDALGSHLSMTAEWGRLMVSCLTLCILAISTSNSHQLTFKPSPIHSLNPHYLATLPLTLHGLIISLHNSRPLTLSVFIFTYI